MAQQPGNQVPLFFKLCSDHLSIEAIPRKPLIIDLNGIREHVPQEHEILMWTPHFVVLRNSNGHEITLRKDGRMVVRKAANEEDARHAATQIMSIASNGFKLNRENSGVL